MQSIVPDDRVSSWKSKRAIWVVGGILTSLLILVYLIYRSLNFSTAFSGLSPSEASLIIQDLKENKIRYRLENEGKVIAVPSDKVDAVRVDYAGQISASNRAVGFEIFDTSEMGLTEFAQKIKYQRALQGELAKTIITMIDPIEDARVLLVLPDGTLFSDKNSRSRAAVSLRTSPDFQLSEETVRGIQALVSHAVRDLDANDVVILN